MDTNRYFSKRVTLTAKGIAVLFLLFHHLFYDSPSFTDRYQVSAAPLSWPVLNSLSSYAKICVSIFVFLTGYGMAVSLGRSKDPAWKRRYALSRFLKLECGFTFVYLLTILSSVLQPSRIGAYFAEGRAKGILLMAIDSLGLARFFDTVTYNNTWWYMSFAVFLIFLMPLAEALHERFGICMCALAAMVTSFGIDGSRAFAVYLFSLSLGIWAAQSGLAGKLAACCPGRGRKLLSLLVSLLFFVLFSAIRIKWGFYPWTGGLISLSLAAALFTAVDLLHVRLRFAEVLGKYSMTIFLTHTLIYHHYFTGFIYAPGNWFLILALLTAVSLILALVTELLRKAVRWDSMRIWHLADTAAQPSQKEVDQP